jgi:hypothetical protein
MNPQNFNQEILLITGSGFINRPFCERDTDNNEVNNSSVMEELKRAGRNGILTEWLPELPGYHLKDNEDFIWNIVNAAGFLYITMGPCPVHIDKEASLDPYFFLNTTCKN